MGQDCIPETNCSSLFCVGVHLLRQCSCWVNCGATVKAHASAVTAHVKDLLLTLEHILCKCRRDYNGLLDAIENNKELMTSPLFLLRLIGRGELEIPEALQGKVLKETDMAYKVQCSELRPVFHASGNHDLLSACKPNCLSPSVHQSWCCRGQPENLDRATQEYYRTIQEAIAVIPAFSSDAYYTVKASSSVAAAIICGEPHCCCISSTYVQAVRND